MLFIDIYYIIYFRHMIWIASRSLAYPWLGFYFSGSPPAWHRAYVAGFHITKLFYHIYFELPYAAYFRMPHAICISNMPQNFISAVKYFAPTPSPLQISHSLQFFKYDINIILHFIYIDFKPPSPTHYRLRYFWRFSFSARYHLMLYCFILLLCRHDKIGHARLAPPSALGSFSHTICH